MTCDEYLKDILHTWLALVIINVIENYRLLPGISIGPLGLALVLPFCVQTLYIHHTRLCIWLYMAHNELLHRQPMSEQVYSDILQIKNCIRFIEHARISNWMVLMPDVWTVIWEITESMQRIWEHCVYICILLTLTKKQN